MIFNLLKPHSLIDFGCGNGTWIKAFASLGVNELLGIDGDYVKKENLLIDPKFFRPYDLSKKFRTPKKYDLAISLEVAEHLEKKYAEQFIENIINHSDIILFSAATPGQGGVEHLNEQQISYWAEKFFNHGYIPFDFIRKKLKDFKNIEPWYLYNTLLYIKEPIVSNFPDLYEFRISNIKEIEDLRSLNWKIRCYLLKHLPYFAVNNLAKLKHKIRNGIF
jgi:hypothetical protein